MAGGAPRSTQTRKKNPTLSDRLAVAEAKKEKLEKENKHLNKQLLAAHNFLRRKLQGPHLQRLSWGKS